MSGTCDVLFHPDLRCLRVQCNYICCVCHLFVVFLSQVEEPGENCMMSSIICTLHKILLGRWGGQGM
jgi:hypothetical protein